MLIKQLSVFLENKSGRLTEVTTTLGDARINMSAFSMAENSDFGILRLIVNQPEEALAILKEKKFAVSLTDVICLHCPNTPGSLAKALDILSNEGVSIEYMYAFSMGDSANVIIRTSKPDEAVEVLRRNKLALLAASELYRL